MGGIQSPPPKARILPLLFPWELRYRQTGKPDSQHSNGRAGLDLAQKREDGGRDPHRHRDCFQNEFYDLLQPACFRAPFHAGIDLHQRIYGYAKDFSKLWNRADVRV